MKSTDDSKYKKGDEVNITTDHMPGMKGAEAQINDVENIWSIINQQKTRRWLKIING